MNHFYFVVEGAHDVATIGKILKTQNFNEKKKLDNISDIWKNNLIPEKYPFESNRLDRITPIPSFFQTPEISIAIQVAGGDSKIIDSLDLAMSNIRIKDLNEIDGIAIFYDADQSTALERKQLILDEIQSKQSDICFDKWFFSNDSGDIRGVTIKSGIYIFPNNSEPGTLEDLLIECANCSYNDLLHHSHKYIEKVDDRYKDRWSISDKNKALIGSITNVLNPGKSNQVSIFDRNNYWICDDTIDRSNSLKKLYEFILKFLEIT